MNKNRYGITFSQNFLTNQKLIKRLIGLSNIDRGDLVFEIGTGKGSITRNLANVSKKVITIEKDRNLFAQAKDVLRDYRNVEILNADIINCRLPKAKAYKVFANIPFNLTSVIIRRLTNLEIAPKESFLIVQKEAAERIIGDPVAKTTEISLLLKPFFTIEIIHNFKIYDFRPTPKVQVVMIKISLRDKFLTNKNERENYTKFIKSCMRAWKSNIRKILIKQMSYQKLKKLALNLNFDLKDKPSELTFEQWMDIFNVVRTA